MGILDRTSIPWGSLVAVLNARPYCVPYFSDDDLSEYETSQCVMEKWNSGKLNCEHGVGGMLTLSTQTWEKDWPGCLAVCGYYKCRQIRGKGKVQLFCLVYTNFMQSLFNVYNSNLWSQIPITICVRSYLLVLDTHRGFR